MDDWGVFGYGSLVHPATRPLDQVATVALLSGWRRQWAHRLRGKHGGLTALTVVPSEHTAIRGVYLRSRPGLLDELDAREVGYAKRKVLVQLAAAAPHDADVCTYVYVSDRAHQAPASKLFPIWWSYLECVLAGYEGLGGSKAVSEFIHTTDWFGAPILDDRSQPRYSRAVPLSEERRRVLEVFLEAHGLLANVWR